MTRAALSAMVWLMLASPLVAQAQAIVREGVRKAEVLYHRKDYAGAVAAASSVLAKRPKDPIALAWRASAYVELGDYRRALADYDASLALSPGSANALLNACWARALIGTDLDRALAFCNRSLAQDAGYSAYDTRGFLRLRRGEYALAVADYDAALRARPNLASSHYGRGLAKLRLGRAAEARVDLAAAAKLQPGVAAVYARRGLAAR